LANGRRPYNIHDRVRVFSCGLCRGRAGLSRGLARAASCLRSPRLRPLRAHGLRHSRAASSTSMTGRRPKHTTANHRPDFDAPVTTVQDGVVYFNDSIDENDVSACFGSSVCRYSANTRGVLRKRALRSQSVISTTLAWSPQQRSFKFLASERESLNRTVLMPGISALSWRNSSACSASGGTTRAMRLVQSSRARLAAPRLGEGVARFWAHGREWRAWCLSPVELTLARYQMRVSLRLATVI